MAATFVQMETPKVQDTSDFSEKNIRYIEGSKNPIEHTNPLFIKVNWTCAN